VAIIGAETTKKDNNIKFPETTLKVEKSCILLLPNVIKNNILTNYINNIYK